MKNIKIDLLSRIKLQTPPVWRCMRSLEGLKPVLACSQKIPSAPAEGVSLSDTVTLPLKEMREAMASAEVGDDIYHEEPNVNKLQEIAVR